MKNILVLLCCFFTGMLVAQNGQETLQKKQKIGLVLSGGGAKGLAHIGVLKVLDSLGINVDYVAGTSMGAVVGSLYAAGYTGKQIDSVFKKANFDAIINDNLPREAKTFYERDNSEKYALSLPLKNFKIKLPSALSRGQNMQSLLTKLLLHVNQIENFDDLPIPFFCIATNIENGAEVVLNQGSLPQAISASAAFPSLFQPIKINNQLLIDGGVVNNYPVEELREKGMDVIIGVDVQDDLYSREALQSAPKILLQISNFRTIKDMRVKSKLTDIYIKPNISGYNVVSFNDGRQIIDNGEKEALNHIEALTQISKQQQTVNPLQVAIKPIDSLYIHNINVLNNNNYSRSYILGKLKFKPNQKIAYNTFQEGVNNLAATNNFDNVSFQLQQVSKQNSFNVLVDVEESKQKTFLKLAIHYDDLYKSGLLINLTNKKILFRNDVSSLDFVVGDNIRYNFEYYIDKGYYWSIGFKSRFNQFKKNLQPSALLTSSQVAATNVNQFNARFYDFTNQLFLQTLFQKDFSLTLGAEHKHLKINTETILANTNQNETNFENSSFISLYGGLKLDSYNDKYFPTDGFYFNGDFHLYLYSSDFNDNFSQFSIAKASLGYSQQILPRFSGNISTQGGFKIGDNATKSLNFALGGNGNSLINNYDTFLGYDFLQLFGNSFVKGTIKLDYEFVKKTHLNAVANYANIEDNIFETGEWITAPDYSGYAVGLAYDSFLGPIEVVYSRSPEINKNNWFFSLGFWF